MNQEIVLCIPHPRLLELGVGRGFTPFEAGHGRGSVSLLNAADTFLPRGEAETDSRYKQIVTYCIVERETSDRDEPVVFAYRRCKDGETRLRGLVSIGVGGHVSREDCAGVKGRFGVEFGVLRELDEEVVLNSSGPPSPEWLGVINDDSDEVGRVHLGVVARVRSRAPIRSAHDHWDHHRFYNVSEFRYPDLFAQCESWTRILLRDLYGVRPGA